MFFINHTDIGEHSAAIIEIDGHLSSDSAPDFDDYINKLIENNIIYLLIDMKNLSFISSAGIGAILMVQKFINEKNGLAVFFNLNYEITSLFKLLGFDLIFNISSDRAEALHILDKHMELFPDETSHEVSVKDNFEEPPLTEEKLISEKPHEKDSRISEISTFMEMPETSGTSVADENEIKKEIFETFIIECIKCKSLIRINEQGEQLCPYCNAEFTVTDQKKAIFKIRDIREIHS